ncbi:hypothetical protein Bca101_001374 [Brassica carinata]
MDLSRIRSVLQCIDHMGSDRSKEDVYQRRYLPRDELVLPRRHLGSSSLLVLIEEVPGEEMAKTHPYSIDLLCSKLNATSQGCALLVLDHRWGCVQLLHLQEVLKLVGEAQLHPLCSA